MFVGKDGLEVGFEVGYEDEYEDGIEDDKMDEGVEGMLDALRRLLRAASMRVNVSFVDDDMIRPDEQILFFVQNVKSEFWKCQFE